MKNRPFNAAIFDGEASRPFDGLKIFRCSNWSIDSSRIYNSVGSTMAHVLASQAEAIVDLGGTWPQHRIDIH